MRINKFDVFEVYKDGERTFRAMAIEDSKLNYVLCIKVDSIGVDNLAQYVDVDNEIQEVLFNIYSK